MIKPHIVACIADVHVGNHQVHGGPMVAGLNERCRMILAALQQAVRFANQRGAAVFLVCGDLFDSARPEPQALSAARDALVNFNGSVVLLVGNHERNTMKPGDHALGVMRWPSKVQVVEQDTYLEVQGVGILALPFHPSGVPLMERCARALMGVSTRCPHSLLALHQGIADGRQEKWLHGGVELAEVEAVMARYGFRATVAGDWHLHKEWWAGDEEEQHSPIVQCGALVPTGYDNPGVLSLCGSHYGCVTYLDFGKEEVPPPKVDVVPGPRFVSLPATDFLPELAVEAAETAGVAPLFLEVKAPPERQDFARSVVDGLADSLGGWRIVPTGMAEQVVEAATVTRAEASLDGAISGWCRSSATMLHVEYAALEERVRRYLGARAHNP